MISHRDYNSVLEMGALVFYETPSGVLFWHDKTCAESIGPFQDLASAMEDYARKKRLEKTLQRKKRVQELQGKAGST